jgi:6-phosphogluconolactonase
VSGYIIDPSTGALTPAPGSPFAVGLKPLAIAANPGAPYVYVVNSLSATLSILLIHADGSLTMYAPSVATGADPAAVAVHPSGRFIFVANRGGASLTVCEVVTIMGVTGPILGSPFATVGGIRSLSVDASGSHLYAANSVHVQTFKIDPDKGAVAPVGTSITAGPLPVAVTTTREFE